MPYTDLKSPYFYVNDLPGLIGAAYALSDLDDRLQDVLRLLGAMRDHAVIRRNDLEGLDSMFMAAIALVETTGPQLNRFAEHLQVDEKARP